MKRTLAVLAGTLVLGSLALAPSVHAHSELVSSDPADGASLEAPPERVSFTFNEPLMPDFVVFVATDPAGATVDLPVSSVEGDTAAIDWPADAPAGEWMVSYRVVSQDGHPIEGGISFSYAESSSSPSPTSASPTSAAPTSEAPAPSTSAAPTSAEPSPSTSPASDTTGTSSGWIIAGIALAAIAIVGVIVALVARRRA